MPDPIELFIAESANILLAGLNDPQDLTREEPVSWQRSGFTPRSKNFPERILDASGAQRLESGNFILLNAVNEGVDAWAVLIPLEFQRNSALIAFRARGAIQTALDPAQFIAKSYLYILNRPADADGMATYVAAITNGTLSHAELLLALASSVEAGIQYERLLVYPMTGAQVLDGGIEDAAFIEERYFLVSKETLAEPAD